MLNNTTISGLCFFQGESKNTVVKKVYDLCLEYNRLPSNFSSTEVKQKLEKKNLDLLHKICIEASNYLTSKKPNQKQKNSYRWKTMTKLMEEIGRECASLGAQTVYSPTNFKTITGDNRKAWSYWLEVVDTLHRPGQKLSDSYIDWLNDTNPYHSNQSFWEYAEHDHTCFNVAYTEPDAFSKYQVGFKEDGKLHELNGSVFSTQGLEAGVMGRGWGIYVITPTGEMYSGKQEVNEFHHSSFLGGRPVMAAGELLAVDGVIKMITAHSGHYRPSWQNMLRMVKNIEGIPSNALIWPDISAANATPRVYFVRDFRLNGLDASPVRWLDIESIVPPAGKARIALELKALKDTPNRERAQRAMGGQQPWIKAEPTDPDFKNKNNNNRP